MKNINKKVVVVMLALFFQFSAVFSAVQYETRLEKWAREAGKGDMHSQYKLGIAYLRGNEVKVDSNKAVFWLKKSAANNYVKAMYQLGLCYYDNQCVDKDKSLAFRWFKAAASKGYAPAQYLLSESYLIGHGTKKSPSLALAWIKRAKKNGMYNTKKLKAKIEKAIQVTARAELIVQPLINESKVVLNKRKEILKLQRLATAKKIKSAKIKKRVIGKKSRVKTKSLSDKLTAAQTKARLMAVSWNLKNKKNFLIPSKMTSCVQALSVLKCESKKISESTKDYSATYVNRTIISDFESNGLFTIQYQRKYFYVMPYDPDDPKPTYYVPQIGETKSISLKCKLESKRSIHCYTKDRALVQFSK